MELQGPTAILPSKRASLRFRGRSRTTWLRRTDAHFLRDDQWTQVSLAPSHLQAWKRLGLEEIGDADDGFPQRVAELVENRRGGLRQLTSQVYPLKGAHILIETMVKRFVLMDSPNGKVATGVELADTRSRRF